jgi:hypothetical protein
LTSIKFFEGELRLIADCLRCTGAHKVAKLPRSNVGGVDTRLRVVSRRRKNTFWTLPPIFAGTSRRHRFRRSADAEREMRRAEQRII